MHLLRKYGLRASFYTPRRIDYEVEKGRPFDRLSDDEIHQIGREQEIGAHTLNHIYLTQVSLAEAEKEIKDSKEWLERLLNRKIDMFSYPGGAHSPVLENIVRSAGFKGARTTQPFSLNWDTRFALGVSLQCYPCFPINHDWSAWFHAKMWRRVLAHNLTGIRRTGLPRYSALSWTMLAKRMFDRVQRRGGVWHLWGHSWEIERYQMWSDLEKVFRYIAGRSYCSYLTNGETIDKL